MIKNIKISNIKILLCLLEVAIDYFILLYFFIEYRNNRESFGNNHWKFVLLNKHSAISKHQMLAYFSIKIFQKYTLKSNLF